MNRGSVLGTLAHLSLAKTQKGTPPKLRKCENRPSDAPGTDERESKTTALARVVITSDKNDTPSTTGLRISQFSTRAQIPKWSDSFNTRPKQLPNYNNDLYIESYQKSKYHTSGQQRKGIFESVIGATDRHDHIVKACALEFPLAKDIKLPEDLERALDFHTNTPSGQIRSFWASQAARLASLAQLAGPTQAAWDALIPHTISYAAKGIRPAVFAPLLQSQGWAVPIGYPGSFSDFR